MSDTVIAGGGDGVTVVVRRRVRPERVAAFEEWLHGIIDAATHFEGHSGAIVIRPEDPERQDYVIAFRFSTAAELERWERSEERAAWLSQVEALTHGEGRVDRVTGLEYWFQLPNDAARRPPPRYKMALVTLLAIYPLVQFLVPLLARWLSPLPSAVVTFLSSIVLVCLMTWLVMPTLTRLFARWLFSRLDPSRSGATDRTSNP